MIFILDSSLVLYSSLNLIVVPITVTPPPPPPTEQYLGVSPNIGNIPLPRYLVRNTCWHQFSILLASNPPYNIFTSWYHFHIPSLQLYCRLDWWIFDVTRISCIYLSYHYLLIFVVVFSPCFPFVPL